MAKRKNEKTKDKTPPKGKDKKPPKELDIDKIITNAKLEAAREIAEMPVELFKEKFAGLYGKIAARMIAEAAGANLKIPGFLLDPEDPFAEGAARTYANLKKTGPLRLPLVLPYKDKATIKALQNYIQRASGAGDEARAKVAREALAKLVD